MLRNRPLTEAEIYVLIGAGGSAAWTPAALSGHLWTVAGSALTGGSGAAVTSWADIGGTSRFTQAVAGKRGTVFVSGGKQALRLDGVDDGYDSVSNSLTAGAQTVGICCSVRSWNNGTTRVIQSPSVTGIIQPGRFAQQSVYVNGNVTSAAQLIATSDSGVHTVIITKASAGNWALHLDGVSQAVTANAINWVETCIGAGGGNLETCDSDIWAISALNAQLGATDIASLHTYLRAQAP